jgi:heme-degrading monooxygenase HmoA
MLKHIVAWKLTGETPEEVDAQAAKIKQLLEDLAGVIPEIASISVVRNVVAAEANSDVAVVSEFADEGALNAYLKHPAHLEAGKYIKSVTAARAAIDYLA